MNLNNNQILLFISFFICIGLITCYYKNINYNIEKFSVTISNPVNSRTNNEKTSKSTFSNPDSTSVDNPITIFTDSDISDITVKNTANSYLLALNNILNRYSQIDPALNVTNNGVLCDNILNNNCSIVEGSQSNDPQCLINNVLTSCSSFYNDGTINQYSNIDVSQLQSTTRNKMLFDCNNIYNTLSKQDIEINNKLNNLTDKLDLLSQQKFFIKYNINNLNDKQQIIDKDKKEFDKRESDLNINKINFSYNLSENNSSDTNLTLYYNIILGLIIVIIIVGILNLFFSNFY